MLFCFLTGNLNDHLKNFSSIDSPGIGNILAPAYDMVATALIMPEDEEELVLTLNGRKRKLKRADFEAALNTLKLAPTIQRNIFNRFTRILPEWNAFIDLSFLNNDR